MNNKIKTISTEILENKYYKFYLANRKQITGSPINKDAMPEKEMADKLVVLASTILNSPKYQGEFQYVSEKLLITFDDIINTVLFYTLDLNKVENSDYFDNYAMRACLRLHALVQDSYHRDKHNAVKNMMNNPQIKTAIEFGCGFPSDYVFAALEQNQHITLTDYDQSALTYCKTVLEYHNKGYKNNISFNAVDINKMENPGPYDAYIMLDSLEHTADPTAYLTMLVDNMPKGAHLITSLPIGNIDTMSHAHHIEFLSENDIIEWLESAGLKIMSSVQTKPNPKVDYFASLLVGGYIDLIVDAIKK